MSATRVRLAAAASTVLIATGCAADDGPVVSNPTAPPSAAQESSADEPADTPTVEEETTTAETTTAETTDEATTDEDVTSEGTDDDISSDDPGTDDATSDDIGDDTGDDTGDASGTEGAVGFGDTYRWPTGLAVTVGAPSEFNRDESAAGGENFDTHVRFDVTVTNDTDDDVDLSWFYAAAQSDGVEGDQIFDYLNGLEGAPFEDLAPGDSIDFPIGFGVEDIDDITMQVSIDWDLEDAVFSTGN